MSGGTHQDAHTSLWRNTDFLKLWSAQTVSVTGSMLGALQLTAVLTLDPGPSQMALVTASGLVPSVVLGLAIGAWVDRLPRRPMLFATDLGRMALLGSIPVAWALDVLSFPQLYLIAFFHGLLTIFFDVAYRSYLPALVSSNQLVDANSKLSASASAAEVGAFSFGGWIAQLSSAVTVAAVDSATFLVSALLLARVRRREDAPGRTAESRSVRREIVEGLRLVVKHRLLRAIVVSRAAVGIGGGIVGTLIVLFGIDTLGFAPGVLGSIFAIGGVSSILGALGVARLTRIYGLGRTLTIGFLVGVSRRSWSRCPTGRCCWPGRSSRLSSYSTSGGLST
jgi:MFS family permease